MTTVTGFAMLLAAVLGFIVANGEFRHSTATQTYLATPRRARVLAAKAVAAVSVGSVAGLVAGVISTGIGLIFVLAHGDHVALSTRTLVAHLAGAVIGAALLAPRSGSPSARWSVRSRHRDRGPSCGPSSSSRSSAAFTPPFVAVLLPHRSHHSRRGETRRSRVRSRPRAQRRCPPTVRRRRSPHRRHRRRHGTDCLPHHATTDIT